MAVACIYNGVVLVPDEQKVRWYCLVHACMNVSLLGVQSMHYDMIEIQHWHAVEIHLHA